MDFLKILLSTLIIALVTALVFFGLYFLFPDVAEMQFGVSVNYQPEKVPSASINGRLASEREKADGKPAEKAEAVPAPEEKAEDIVVVHEIPAEPEPVVQEAPVPEVEETVKKEEPAPVPAVKEEPEEELPAFTAGGETVKKFMESTKVQIVLSFLPDSVDASALKKPEDWNANDITQINKIGDYLLEHDIDIDRETRISNIPKLLNQYRNNELPQYLQDFLEFVQTEVQF